MVVEVGLLGRYDSTNVGRADVAVITNVRRDHTDGAGDWRRAIAEEKAGIIEPDSAVIIGETDPELVEIFRSEGGALHWVRDEHFGARRSAVGLGGRQVDLYTPHGRTEDLFLPVHGAHQVDNAAIALAAVEAFFDRRIDHDVATGAFLGLELPGRFEVVGHHPLLVLDGAHNVGGAGAFAAHRERRVHRRAATPPSSSACSADPTSTTWSPRSSRSSRTGWCAPEPASPRAARPSRLREVVSRLRPDVEVLVVDDVGAAVEAAHAAAFDDDAVLVAGSLYTVGAARGACRHLGLLAA